MIQNIVSKIRNLQQNLGFMKYFRNTSWLFSEKILRMVVGLFVGVWVARYLGPEQFGLFSYAQSFVGLFAVIATLGLDGIVIRELVKDENRRDELICTAFWLKFIGAIIVLLVLLIAIQFTSNDNYTNKLIFIIASATILQAVNVVDMYFQARILSRYVVFANIISLFISSVIKIILILNEASLIAFAWAALFDSFVVACGYIYFYFRHSSFDIKNLTFNKSTAISLLRDSWPLILSGIVITIYMKIDQVMIMEMMDAESVGQYAAAVRINEAWYFIPMAITSSLFPAIVNAKKVSSELYYQRLQKMYDFMVVFSIALTIPMFFLNSSIINILYGSQYNQSAGVLLILFCSTLSVSIGVSNGLWLLNENLQRINVINKTLGMLLNIILNLLLIPKFGIKGSAYATLISYFVTNYFILLLFKNTRPSFINISKSLNLYRVYTRNFR